MKQKHRGTLGELRAAAWLLEQGYDVFRNVSPFGDTDIIGIRDGKIERFDVKTYAGLEHMGYFRGPPEIKLLLVYPDGRCEIRAPRIKVQGKCERCKKILLGPKKRWCSDRCAALTYRERTTLEAL